MTNYSNNSGSVRVEFFKPSGKWYMTEAWDMSKYYSTGPTPYDAVKKMFEDKGKSEQLTRFIVVVNDPYHENAYPVILVPELMWRAYYGPMEEKKDGVG
jgi:hypothetical protein